MSILGGIFSWVRLSRTELLVIVIVAFGSEAAGLMFIKPEPLVSASTTGLSADPPKWFLEGEVIFPRGSYAVTEGEPAYLSFNAPFELEITGVSTMQESVYRDSAIQAARLSEGRWQINGQLMAIYILKGLGAFWWSWCVIRTFMRTSQPRGIGSLVYGFLGANFIIAGFLSLLGGFALALSRYDPQSGWWYGLMEVATAVATGSLFFLGGEFLLKLSEKKADSQHLSNDFPDENSPSARTT